MPRKPATETASEIALDEKTIDALRERLYADLRESLLTTLQEELLQEQRVPLYYDRFISSETKRLEDAIERNGERIAELRVYINQRLNEQREDIFRHIDRSAMWTRVMNSAVLALLTALLAKLIWG